MVNVKREGLLLTKTAFDFEHKGVLNPSVYQEGNTLHMFYRAIGRNNHSTIGYCRLEGPMNVVERLEYPILFPELEYESHGVEDPRVVKIDGLFYMTFTVYDGINAMGALATSTNLKVFDRCGIITPEMSYEEFCHLAKLNPKIPYKACIPIRKTSKLNLKEMIIWDKDVVFFPRRIHNRLYFLHRIIPNIQIVSVSNLNELTPEFWKKYILHLDEYIVITQKYKFENSHMGAGSPPIETEVGWLILYHSVERNVDGLIYNACAALLDLDNPLIEIARLPYVLFGPVAKWEVSGYVNNVVFPTGVALFGETLYIYYGAADKRIACASVCLKELIEELMSFKIPKN